MEGRLEESFLKRQKCKEYKFMAKQQIWAVLDLFFDFFTQRYLIRKKPGSVLTTFIFKK